MSSQSEFPIRVTLMGLGTVGRDFARLAAAAEDIEIVAACSRNPQHVGRTVAELAGVGGDSPVVDAGLAQALETPSDVLVLATASRLDEVVEAIEAGIAAGRDVITSSEEAAFPWAFDAELAERLDAAARAAGVSLLGTGVNPGFTYDALVLAISGAGWDVAGLSVERVVDISGYSEAILLRSGVAVSPETFRERCETGEITGHIGFPQSMNLVARAMGRTIERIDRAIEPLLAESELEAAGLRIAPGSTAGFVQHYEGICDGSPWFTAHLVAHVDPAAAGLSTRDVIEVAGSVPLRMVAEPAFDSQTTVAAVLANSLARVRAAAPGWLTVADLPPAFPTGRRRSQASVLTEPEGSRA